MNVVAFIPRQLLQDGRWRAYELRLMQSTFAAHLKSGSSSGWHLDTTEVGDPQLYLLDPDGDCILSISRLGSLYVLEDGAGRVVYENVNLDRLTERARSFLLGGKASLIARCLLVWTTVRHTFEEKIEPVLVEGEELLLQVAPQLASIV